MANRPKEFPPKLNIKQLLVGFGGAMAGNFIGMVLVNYLIFYNVSVIRRSEDMQSLIICFPISLFLYSFFALAFGFLAAWLGAIIFHYRSNVVTMVTIALLGFFLGVMTWLVIGVTAYIMFVN